MNILQRLFMNLLCADEKNLIFFVNFFENKCIQIPNRPNAMHCGLYQCPVAFCRNFWEISTALDFRVVYLDTKDRAFIVLEFLFIGKWLTYRKRAHYN